MAVNNRENSRWPPIRILNMTNGENVTSSLELDLRCGYEFCKAMLTWRLAMNCDK